ncbi:FlgD immunoglobulin-like domain containing protein [bacterium]
MKAAHQRTSDPRRISQFVLLTLILLFFGQMAVYGQIPEWAWVKQAGGSGMDIAYDVAVDGSGNVYVVGRQDGATFGAGETTETTLTSAGGFIAKYNSYGELVWVKEIIGGKVIAIAINSYNDVLILGSFTSSVTFAPGLNNELIEYIDDSVAPGIDRYIAKYSTNGDFVWMIHPKYYTYESPQDIAVDSRDYITEVGYGWESPSSTWSHTVQYDAGGSYIWGAGHPGDHRIYAQSVCNDNLDNCYATGYTFPATSSYMTAAKYDDLGNRDFIIRTSDVFGSHAYGVDIDVDLSGYIYISGTYTGDVTFGEGESNETILSTTSTLPYLAKFNSDSTLLWIKERNTQQIALDPGGYIYSAGYISGTTIFGEGQPNETTVGTAGAYDLYIAKYDSSGYFLWVKTEGAAENDEINDLFVDSNGVAHVAGYFEQNVTFGAGESNETTLNSDGNEDIFVAQLGTVNPEISGVVFYYPSITMIEGAEINFIGLGSAYTVANGYYQMTVPFGWSGTAMAMHPGLVFDIPTRTYDFVSSNRVNQDYWVLGDAVLPVSGYVTLQSNQQPLENVALTFDNGGGTVYSSDSAYYVNYVPYQWSGTVTPSLSGYVFDPAFRTYSSITAGQFNQDYTGSGTGVESTEAIPTKTELYSNYPNPFNMSTTLTYSLSRPTDVRLDIYDINGRLIRLLHKGRQEPGTFTVQWYGRDDNGLPVSSGIYTCRMMTEKNVFRQKLILIK